MLLKIIRNSEYWYIKLNLCVVILNSLKNICIAINDLFDFLIYFLSILFISSIERQIIIILVSFKI